MADSEDAPVSYWRPDERFARLVTGFHRYRVRLPAGTVLRDVFFPSHATIRVAIDDPQPWSQRLGPRRYDMPVCSFSGPTSHAGYTESTHGTLVGIGLLSEGWARLFGGDLSHYANRVVPLDRIEPGARELHTALAAGADPVAVFEQWLDERLATPRAVDPLVPRLQALIDDPAISRIETIAENLGISPRSLATLSRYHFGFTPKVLLRRGRFLRALSVTLDAPAEEAAGLLARAGYWDRSHFLRDSHLFLGCSIRAFRPLRGPLNALALPTRAQAFGTPV